jgi:hypothetical protein
MGMSKNAGKLASGIHNETGDRPKVIPYSNTARERGPRPEQDLERKPALEVDFAELSDGSMAEMIEDPQDATRTLFAVHRNQSISYADRVEDDGRILMPLSRENENVKYVRLAQGAGPYGRVQNLEKEVGLILRACLDLDANSLTLMTAFVISTWLQEKAPIAPYLALVGPPGSGKTTAMRVLNSICYRGILTGDISASAFYDLCHRIRPTLLLDETLTAGRPRELIHLLKVSSTPDAVSLRKGSARLAYGPKVFAWLELPNDAALNSRCLILPMHRTSRTDLKDPNEPQMLESANAARKHLLHFRLEHFKHSVVPNSPSEVGLSARPLDLYRAIAFPFAQDPQVCLRLARLVAQQREHQSQMLSPAQASLLRVLYLSIHQREKYPATRLKVLTAAVNHDLLKRGETHKLNERKIGDILTSLSLTNRTRTNTGYVLWLTRLDRERIHVSFRDYMIEEMSEYPFKKCALCRQIQE